MLYKYIKIIFLLFIVVGCAVQNNLEVSINRGKCNNGYSNAPYCVAITISNNANGQNYINSSNFSISNLQVLVNGSYNISYPSSSKAMDPNNCTSKTIIPGENCTFFMVINKESYPVGSNQKINVMLKYVINSNLFGGGGQNATTNFSLVESTNLYVVSNTTTNFAYVNLYSGDTISIPYLAESVASATSVIIDNNSYGYLYIATQNGMFYYGNESGYLSTLPSGVSGLNNLVVSTLSPQTSGNSSPNMYGVSSDIYSFTFDNITWGKSLVSNLTGVKTNISAVSVLGNIFLTNGTNIYNCNLNSSTQNCTSKLKTFNNISGMVNSTKIPNNYTGLYVIESDILLAESTNGDNLDKVWINVIDVESNNLSNVTALTNNSNGDVYVGDSLGQIWKITLESPNIATKMNINKIGAIQPNGMIYDNFANILYVISTNQLYKCNIKPSFLCSPIGGNIMNSNVVKMAIGSSLNPG